jgi:hypothetical protein
MARPTDSDIAQLIGYLQGAARRMVHVPGRGDMEPVDEYRVIVTAEQREWLIEALRRYPVWWERTRAEFIHEQRDKDK